MSKRKPDVYLQDILESIQQIEEYLDDVNENEFYQNSEKQDAVLRRLEIIGEVVKHISDDIRDEYDEVPWRKITGMRDITYSRIFWSNSEHDLGCYSTRSSRSEIENSRYHQRSKLGAHYNPPSSGTCLANSCQPHFL